ncbi:MAG TPA: YIP1 family protein [Acidobacteriota bacterium]|jgi:hypothetical protein
MDFAGYVKKALELCKFNIPVYDQIATDPNAFTMGLIFLAIGGAAAALGSFAPLGIVLYPIVMIVGFFIFMGILHLLATLFGGSGDFMALFRIGSIGSIVNWPAVIPIIGWIVGLWLLPITVVAVERTYKLERGKAVLVVLIPVGVLLLIGSLLVVAAGLAVLTFFRNA